MIDAVVSVHTNPLTCGTAKWNQQLAERLGKPLLRLGDHWMAHHPLFSLRRHELDRDISPSGHFSMMVHEIDEAWREWIPKATEVFAANGEIAAWIRPLRPDVIEAFCPGTVQGDPTRGTIDVLAFGMAHKFTAPYFERLKTILDASVYRYTISLSTAIHEGTPWAEGFQHNVALMRDIFGDRLRHLGFLADDGLARVLHSVNYAALFFEPAARANNTSLWAALSAGLPIITNLDGDSPSALRHDQSVFDIAQLTELPMADRLRVVRKGGVDAALAHSWERLLPLLRGVTVDA